jgi:hypothetical protein
MNWGENLDGSGLKQLEAGENWLMTAFVIFCRPYSVKVIKSTVANPRLEAGQCEDAMLPVPTESLQQSQHNAKV